MTRRLASLGASWLIVVAPCGCGDDSASTRQTPLPPLDASDELSAEAGAEAAAEAGIEDVGPADVAHEASTPDVVEPDSPMDAQDDTAAQEASTDAGTGWKVEVVDATPKFKSRVAIAAGPDGEPRLAYNVATSDNGYQTPSVWYAERYAGAWKTVEAAPAGGVSNEFPVIAVDASGKAQVVYKRAEQGQNDLFAVKGDGTGFDAPVKLTTSADADEFAPAAVFDQTGTLHVIFQRTREDPNATPPKSSALGYLQVSSSGAVSSDTDVATTSEFGLDPDFSLAVDPSGAVHVVYCKPGINSLNNVAYYRRREAGQWGEEVRLTALDQDAWGPVVGADDSGNVHFAYVIGPDWDHKTLTYDRLNGGTLAGAQPLSTSTLDRSYYLGMNVHGGIVHLAFSRFYDIGGSNMADVHYLRAVGGVFEPEERLTSTDALDESATALTVTPNGAPFLAFVENLSEFPDGKIFLASRP